MSTFKLLVSYDGTNYFGWQAQNGQRSVQETIEGAIASVTGQNVRILASGRTDSGVHALGQVVSVCLDTRLTPQVLCRALNANLPSDIVVLETTETHDGFHPTHKALRKRYRYLIHDGPVRDVFRRRYCWHFNQGRLDAEAMHRSSAALIGRHDFSSFESSGSQTKDSVRTIFDLSIQRGSGDELGTVPIFATAKMGLSLVPHEQHWIVIEVEADGFLYNMVRAIVGTLVEVGRGVKPESWPAEVLLAADRRLAGPTAPPQGLFLVKVDY
jgi:tRNA pseudouridine38-40 synthase